MNRDVENPEMDENLNEMMNTAMVSLAHNGNLLAEKHAEDLKKSMKNNFEEMMKEIKESKKLTQENIEDMKKCMEFLMKENEQLKKKVDSPKKFNEESYA